MKYYEVTKQNYYIINKKTKKLYTLIKNELLTEKEVEKLKNTYYITEKMQNELFRIVNISKNKTYFFFGARLIAKRYRREE